MIFAVFSVHVAYCSPEQGCCGREIMRFLLSIAQTSLVAVFSSEMPLLFQMRLPEGLQGLMCV